MSTTTYKGERFVDLEYLPVDGDYDTFCPNDDCPGIEVEGDVDEDDGTFYATEVRRIAWNCGWHGPTGPTYSCGGEPGYADRPECPECGEGGEEI